MLTRGRERSFKHMDAAHADMGSIHKLARFEVRRDKVDEALALIRGLIDEIGRKEGGTASYLSLQDKETPTRFTHYMVFRTPAAEDYHRKTAWMKKFVDALYPMCVEEPSFTTVEPVAKA